jgi:hypothetical protein
MWDKRRNGGSWITEVNHHGGDRCQRGGRERRGEDLVKGESSKMPYLEKEEREHFISHSKGLIPNK